MEREKPVDTNTMETPQTRTSARKRPRAEWVSDEHIGMRKKLRTMSLDEIAAYMVDLKRQTAAAQSTAAHSQTDGLYDDEEEEEEEGDDASSAAGMDIDAPPPLPSLTAFSDIPHEMMASVIARLVPADITSAGETCRLLHEIVTENRHVLELVGTPITVEVVQWINRFKRLGVLVLKRVTLPTYDNPLGQLALPALREIYMADMVLPDHGVFLGKLSGLQKAHFDRVNNTSATDSFQTIIPPSLETLVVLRTPLRHVACTNTMTLKHIIYHSTDLRAANYCMAIVRHFSASLRTLECGLPNYVTDVGEVPLNLVNLRTLRLHNSFFSYVNVTYFLTVPFAFGVLPALTQLELDTFESVSEVLFLRTVAPCTPVLRELIFPGVSIDCTPNSAATDYCAWNTAFPCLELLKMTTPQPETTQKEDFGACLNRIARMGSLRHLAITNVAAMVDSSMLWSMCRLNTLRLETLILGDIGPLSASDILTLYAFVPTLKRVSIF